MNRLLRSALIISPCMILDPLLQPADSLLVHTQQSLPARCVAEFPLLPNLLHILTRFRNQIPHDLRILALRHRGELLYHLPRGAQRALRRLLGSFPAPSGERFIRNYQLRILWAVLCDGLLADRFGCGDSLFLFARKPGC